MSMNSWNDEVDESAVSYNGLFAIQKSLDDGLRQERQVFDRSQQSGIDGEGGGHGVEGSWSGPR